MMKATLYTWAKKIKSLLLQKVWTNVPLQRLIAFSILKKIAILIILHLLSKNVNAQNMSIVGDISNTVLKEISVTIDYTSYDGTQETHTMPLDDKGHFEMIIPLIFPVEATIEYARNKTNVFLEPGGFLSFKSSATAFPFDMVMSGSTAANNKALQQFRRDYPIESNQFLYTQYRKENYRYNLEPKVNDLMRSSSISVYTNTMAQKMDSKKRSVISYESMFGEQTPKFKDYINAEITYDYALKTLAYGHIFKGMHRITRNYFSILDAIPLQSEQLGSVQYREYLAAFINWKQFDESPDLVSYVAQYDLAEKLLESRAKRYLQCRIIKSGIEKQYTAQLMPSIELYSQNNEYYTFNDYIDHALTKASAISIGAPAPNFQLTDINGNIVNLSDYRGKIIYLDFWASWCSPCVSKIPKMIDMSYRLSQDSKIVFLHISFDEKQDNWNTAVKNRNWQAQNIIHLNEPLYKTSTIAKDYHIAAVPTYYIINKEGFIAPRPLGSSIEELEKHLLLLAQ